MENPTGILPPAGATHTIKDGHGKSPLWNVIKALGNKCFYFNGTQWMDSLDENYLGYYLKYYDAVTHEEIPTETPEEAEAFNKMKPYEFDEHVSGEWRAKTQLMMDAINYFNANITESEYDHVYKRGSSYITLIGCKHGLCDKRYELVCTVDEIYELMLELSGWTPTLKPVNDATLKPSDTKPVFTQAMADKGGAKYDHGKPRYDLLPAIAIDEMAKVLTFGAEKYSPNSWQNVPDAINRYRAALLRHTFAIQRGELIDDESGLPHSALAMTNAAFIVELEKKC